MTLLPLLVVAFVASATEVSVQSFTNSVRNLVDVLPHSPALVDLESHLLATPTPEPNPDGTKILTKMNVQQDIAKLLLSMYKDMNEEEIAENKKHVKESKYCEGKLRTCRDGYLKNKAAEITADQIGGRLNASLPLIITNKVLPLDQKMDELLETTLPAAEKAITEKQTVRDAARGQYYIFIDQFNQALDDVDKLYKILMTSTLVFASQKEVVSKDELNNDSFLQEATTDQLASLDNEQKKQVLQQTYKDLRSQISHPRIVALVATLDTMTSSTDLSDNGATDKIRQLLIEVRNELQKTKRDATAAEQTAITQWHTEKLQLRDAINDYHLQFFGYKLQIANAYSEYSETWLNLADSNDNENKASYEKIKFSTWYNFTKADCLRTAEEYKRGSNKRKASMAQIKLVLDLLDKLMAADTTYSPKIKEGVEEIRNRCNRWDSYSRWVNVPSKFTWRKGRSSNISPKTGDLPKEAYDIYNDKEDDTPFVCFSKLFHTYRSTGKTSIRSSDGRLPSDAVDGHTNWQARVGLIDGAHNYNIDNNFTVIIADHTGNSGALSWDKEGYTEILTSTSQNTEVTREKMAVFVVPGCNCLPKPSPCPKGFKALPKYHTAPAGRQTCDYGAGVPFEECHAATQALLPKDKTNVRTTQVGSDGSCGTGSWNEVPKGCSAQTRGDWAPHFNKLGSTCPGPGYQLLCTGDDYIKGSNLLTKGEQYKFEAHSECANACKAITKCKSYTWAPFNTIEKDKRVCMLYEATKPTDHYTNQYQTTQPSFCIKE